jgi:peptidoglycan/LPS O-acetylase OafA/YrhL
MGSASPKLEPVPRIPPLPSRLTAWALATFSRETTSGRFIPEMDGLRFVAIGMVVLFHLNGYLAAKSASSLAPGAQASWLAQVALVGFRGVELFFVISGFILGLPFAAHYLHGAPQVSLKKYYLRRLTRLEPPYIVTVFALFVLALCIQVKTAADLSPHLAASLLYVHNLVYGASSPVIGVAWSLEIEVQFYLLVPLLTLMFGVRNPRVRRCTLMGFAFVLQAIEVICLHGSRISLSILAYLPFFLVGFVLADLFLADWREAPSRSLWWDVVALVGWPVLLIVLHFDRLAHWAFPYLVLLLYCAAFRGLFTNYFFTNRWITCIGGMCYSIYLIHYEVISLVGRFTRRMGMHQPYWLYLSVQLAVVGVAILLLCGTYFVLLEKPCMRRDWPQRLRRRFQGMFAGRREALAQGEAID